MIKFSLPRAWGSHVHKTLILEVGGGTVASRHRWAHRGVEGTIWIAGLGGNGYLNMDVFKGSITCL